MHCCSLTRSTSSNRESATASASNSRFQTSDFQMLQPVHWSLVCLADGQKLTGLEPRNRRFSRLNAKALVEQSQNILICMFCWSGRQNDQRKFEWLVVIASTCKNFAARRGQGCASARVSTSHLKEVLQEGSSYCHSPLLSSHFDVKKRVHWQRQRQAACRNFHKIIWQKILQQIYRTVTCATLSGCRTRVFSKSSQARLVCLSKMYLWAQSYTHENTIRISYPAIEVFFIYTEKSAVEKKTPKV